MDAHFSKSLKQLGEPHRSILISMIAGEHCLLASEQCSGSELGEVLQSVCLESFDIRPVLVDCKTTRSIDKFHEALLVNDRNDWQDSTTFGEAAGDHRTSAVAMPKRSSLARTDHDEESGKKIANVVIASNLDLAVQEIQVQLIELLRRNRIFTRNAMYTGPKDFLLIVTMSNPTARLTYHLNDMIAISCLDYDPYNRWEDFGRSSIRISKADVSKLRAQAVGTRLTAEMDAFLHDIVLFMRMSRYVQAGVTATATRHLRAICKAIAPMHGITFVTPTIVILGSRQIYPHRIVMATAETEKSLQWGSYPQAVREMLEEINIASVIEDVVASVETPL